jgi:hypothetical protein
MVVLFLLCALVCFASGQIAIGGGGLDDPSLFHQRYRGDESFFSGSEFFQWWFFWVKATNKDGSTSLTQKNLFFFSTHHFTLHYTYVPKIRKSQIRREPGGPVSYFRTEKNARKAQSLTLKRNLPNGCGHLLKGRIVESLL